MNSYCFLLDEHITHEIAHGLRQRESNIQAFVIGQPEAPGLGTPDPDLLHWIEEHGCLLVTNNRSTMPVHLRDHLAIGHHVPGILIIPNRSSLGNIVDQLFLIWAASRPDEYRDRIVYLAVRR